MLVHISLLTLIKSMENEKKVSTFIVPWIKYERNVNRFLILKGKSDSSFQKVIHIWCGYVVNVVILTYVQNELICNKGSLLKSLSRLKVLT